MDTLTLKRTIKDEYGSRFYTMTGGEFTAMKDAVKAAGGKFQQDKSWLVTGQIISDLSSNYNVVEVLPFRAAKFIEGSIHDRGSVSTVEVYFDYRNKYDSWTAVPVTKRISFDTSADAVEAECARITAAAQAVVPTATPYDRYYGVRALARKAVEAEAESVVAQVNAKLGGKFTVEAMKEAIEIMKELCK